MGAGAIVKLYGGLNGYTTLLCVEKDCDTTLSIRDSRDSKLVHCISPFTKLPEYSNLLYKNPWRNAFYVSSYFIIWILKQYNLPRDLMKEILRELDKSWFRICGGVPPLQTQQFYKQLFTWCDCFNCRNYYWSEFLYVNHSKSGLNGLVIEFISDPIIRHARIKDKLEFLYP